MIKKAKGGFQVMSESGKNLGGPYATKAGGGQAARPGGVLQARQACRDDEEAEVTERPGASLAQFTARRADGQTGDSPRPGNHLRDASSFYLDYLATLEDNIVRLPDLPGCWLWIGTRVIKGYGMVPRRGRGREQLAHRVALLARGIDIPPKMMVLHRCDVPACVRPDHLYIGTNRDNQNARWQRYPHREEQREFYRRQASELRRRERERRRAART